MSSIAQAGKITDDSARLRVLDAVKQSPEAFTVADIVTKTGLPPYQAEATLNDIVKAYEADLDVDTEGNLIYRFPAGLKGREDIVKADAKRRRKEARKQALITFFKWWTVAMVVIYFVLYVVLIIAALVAASQGRDNDRRGGIFGGRSGGGGGIWFFWGMSPWGYGGYGNYTTRRQRRDWNRKVDARLQKGEDPYSMHQAGERKKPSLAERTWYYLFGSRGIQRNPLEREKELLTYIRAKKGFISNADIVALLGVTYDEADSIGTRLVATYEGEMDITDDGVAVYRFPNLTLTVAKEIESQSAQLGYVWQLRDKEQALRDHPVKWIPILNVVNIFLALIVGFWAMPRLGITGLGAQLGIVAVPLVFSIAFFAVAASRKARERRNAAQYKRDSIRAAMFKLLFTRRTPVRLPGDERQIAQVGLGEWSASELMEVAPEVAEELRGEVRRTASGIEVRCERVWQEMAVVDKVRARADRSKTVGRTVFSSRMGGASGAPAGDDALAAEIAALEQELS